MRVDVVKIQQLDDPKAQRVWVVHRGRPKQIELLRVVEQVDPPHGTYYYPNGNRYRWGRYVEPQVKQMLQEDRARKLYNDSQHTAASAMRILGQVPPLIACGDDFYHVTEGEVVKIGTAVGEEDVVTNAYIDQASNPPDEPQIHNRNVQTSSYEERKLLLTIVSIASFAATTLAVGIVLAICYVIWKEI